MPKPHILMLAPYLPYPPLSGGRMRTYNLLRHLSANYEMTLICFVHPEERALDLALLQRWCDLVMVDRAPSPGWLKTAWLRLSSFKPVTMRLYHTAEMKRAVGRFLRERPIDLIHVESFYMSQNLPARLDVPVLLSEPAIEYVAWWRYMRVAKPPLARPIIALEALKMRWWEPRAWTEATLVGTMSAVDAAVIKRAAPGVPTVITPNGVDVDYFYMDETIERDSQTAVYIGDYKYVPNLDAVFYFIGEILPLIRAKRPGFQFVVIGKDPPPELMALHDNPDSGVTVTGPVEDTRPYLQRSALFVCPLRSGSGTRFKLLEALACGCPVVSTSTGCEGLGAVNGQHMLIRDTPQAFADAVLNLLDNPERGRTIGQKGQQWVSRDHSWKHCTALLQDTYDKLIGFEAPTVRMSRLDKADFLARTSQSVDDHQAS